MQLCRDLIVAMFTQQVAVKNEQQQQQQQQQNVSEDGLQASDSWIDPFDLTALIKHKEIAALWELLKLATAQGQSSLQTRNTLANVLLGKS